MIEFRVGLLFAETKQDKHRCPSFLARREHISGIDTQNAHWLKAGGLNETEASRVAAIEHIHVPRVLEQSSKKERFIQTTDHNRHMNPLSLSVTLFLNT